MRLDKLLANAGVGSRKEVKALLKKRRVTVNEFVVKDGGKQVDPNEDKIEASGNPVMYQEYYYIMLHKPKAVVSATTDNRDKTVIDLVRYHYPHVNLFPVGRLDKDTEGLLLLTNDGELGHQLTSPRKVINKTYYAVIEGRVTDADCATFQAGVELEDGYITYPAELHIQTSGHISEVTITITEGKYHQIKRMFASIDKHVTYLKRLSMGELYLDSTLEPGEYRELTNEEQRYCSQLKEKRTQV